MYSFLCALGQRCLDGICICGPGDWNIISFVLLKFSVRTQVCQGPGLAGPRSYRICAEYLGAAVGPPWLGTEAPDHQQTVDI